MLWFTKQACSNKIALDSLFMFNIYLLDFNSRKTVRGCSEPNMGLENNVTTLLTTSGNFRMKGTQARLRLLNTQLPTKSLCLSLSPLIHTHDSSCWELLYAKASAGCYDCNTFLNCCLKFQKYAPLNFMPTLCPTQMELLVLLFTTPWLCGSLKLLRKNKVIPTQPAIEQGESRSVFSLWFDKMYYHRKYSRKNSLR